MSNKVELGALETRCRELLRDLGLAEANELIEVVPLSGGVASDIARVKVAQQTYCVKFALPKLKVAADWHVPVHRSQAECAWFRFAASILPSCVPHVFGQSELGFVMEYFSPDDTVVWKESLLNKAPEIQHAQSVAVAIGQIHRESTRSDHCRRTFRNHDDFLAIRIEPYLTFTASKHPSFSRHLSGIGSRLFRSSAALVHGDVSPKNILFRHNRPILLDAECASMGDPAFDVAFCLNHLLLKSIHLPKFRSELLLAALEFWFAYSKFIDWEPRGELEARVAELLPALLLARVDGKSPVEYLSSSNRKLVRSMAVSLLSDAPSSLPELLEVVRQR
ncbi:MAG: aminoglycoside phosphotransferase family protein [Rhodobacteraceae bacterium]|nr:aminoglycoside phosphotransferase family protein [Paracoccaceae bacterium]